MKNGCPGKGRTLAAILSARADGFGTSRKRDVAVFRLVRNKRLCINSDGCGVRGNCREERIFWLRGVDLFPSGLAIPRNLLIL